MPMTETERKLREIGFDRVFPEAYAKCADDHGPHTFDEKTSEKSFLSCFKTLDSIEEEEPRWFVDLFMPEGQISIIASDGGVGKSTLATNIAANRSAGKACFLDPPGFSCEPQRIAFLCTEDSIRKKNKRKLREAGANMANIIVPDFKADKEGLLRSFKFGSPEMAEFVRYFKPSFCVFDPLQGFVPADVNMGSRNAMRDCMAPLVSLGEEVGTTFLVVCHTNKRKGAYGRDRIADSADIWDIARSVLMMDFTEEQGVRYISHEKSNYGELQATRLFSIGRDGIINAEGTTWKRDREFQQEAALNVSAPRRNDCREWIINELDKHGGSMLTSDLDGQADADGFSRSTLRRAKEDLKKDAEIEYLSSGIGKTKIWYIRRVPLPKGWDTSVRDSQMDK